MLTADALWRRETVLKLSMLTFLGPKLRLNHEGESVIGLLLVLPKFLVLTVDSGKIKTLLSR